MSRRAMTLAIGAVAVGAVLSIGCRGTATDNQAADLLMGRTRPDRCVEG